jgi:3-oxoadipate CoA-transferase alpha subunit
MSMPHETHMLDKQWESCAAAVSDINSGSVVLVSGFGGSGVPAGLVAALAETGVTDLTLVANNAGAGEHGLARLFRNGQVSRLICSYPRSQGSIWFEERFFEGSVALELVPQGTLTERIRAGGAGIAGFYTRTGIGTAFAEGKPIREFDGQPWLLETAIRGDFALIRTHQSDRWGNSTYRKSARNYAPTMAAAATTAIVEADVIVPLGTLSPEHIVTPGIYVRRVVRHGS